MTSIRLQRRRYLLAVVIVNEDDRVVEHGGSLHEMRALALRLAAEHGLVESEPGVWTGPRHSLV